MSDGAAASHRTMPTGTPLSNASGSTVLSRCTSDPIFPFVPNVTLSIFAGRPPITRVARNHLPKTLDALLDQKPWDRGPANLRVSRRKLQGRRQHKPTERYFDCRAADDRNATDDSVPAAPAVLTIKRHRIKVAAAAARSACRTHRGVRPLPIPPRVEPHRPTVTAASPLAPDPTPTARHRLAPTHQQQLAGLKHQRRPLPPGLPRQHPVQPVRQHHRRDVDPWRRDDRVGRVHAPRHAVHQQRPVDHHRARRRQPQIPGHPQRRPGGDEHRVDVHHPRDLSRDVPRPDHVARQATPRHRRLHASDRTKPPRP